MKFRHPAESFPRLASSASLRRRLLFQRAGRGGAAGPRTVRTRFVILAALLFAPGLPAVVPLVPFGPASARSVSGQIIVYGARPETLSRRAEALANDASLLKLEPPYVAVSCERVRRAFLDELGLDGQWRGRIFLALHPAQSAEDEITFISERFKDGWSYRLDVPNPVERTRLVRAVVQALLQEQANRHSAGRAAEVPLWLSEGLAQQILATRGLEVILPPPQWSVNGLTISPTVVSGRRADPLANARRTLRARLPLTLEELNWPRDDALVGEAGETYRASAQLLVSELLRFQDGRGCLRAMLAGLPEYFNWQTAFLRAFHSHFEKQLDVEKWWALQTAYFTGRDERQTWSPEESWSKLDEILRAPVQVRQAKGDLPRHAEVPLSMVIREWDVLRQTQVLRDRLNSLDFARQRVTVELVPLVDEYRRVLADYLDRREKVGMTMPGRGMNAPGAKFVVRETLKQLAALDARRAAAKPTPVTTATEQVESPPNPIR